MHQHTKDYVASVQSSDSPRQNSSLSPQQSRIEDLKMRLTHEEAEASILRKILHSKKEKLLRDDSNGSGYMSPMPNSSESGSVQNSGSGVLEKARKQFKSGRVKIGLHKARNLPNPDMSAVGPPSTFVEARIVSSDPPPTSASFEPDAQTVGAPGRTPVIPSAYSPEYDVTVCIDMSCFDPRKLSLLLVVIHFSFKEHNQPIGLVHIPLYWVTEPSYSVHLPRIYTLQSCVYESHTLPAAAIKDAKLFAQLEFVSSGDEETTEEPTNSPQLYECVSPNPATPSASPPVSRKPNRNHVSQGVPQSVKEPTHGAGQSSHVGTDTSDLSIGKRLV